MDQTLSELQQHLPALRWAVPHLVEFAKASPDYPSGMGTRYLDLAVAQAINDVLGGGTTEPRLKGYWIAGYWPSFKTDPPDKNAELEFEFGHRTVCHVGQHVISASGVEHWEEFRARMMATAVDLCATRGLKIGVSQLVLVDLHVGAFSLSSAGTDAAARQLAWLLGRFRAEQEAGSLSSSLMDPCASTADARRL